MESSCHVLGSQGTGVAVSLPSMCTVVAEVASKAPLAGHQCHTCLTNWLPSSTLTCPLNHGCHFIIFQMTGLTNVMNDGSANDLLQVHSATVEATWGHMACQGPGPASDLAEAPQDVGSVAVVLCDPKPEPSKAHPKILSLSQARPIPNSY